MRKGTGTMAWVAWIFVMLTMFTRCDNILGPTYEPRHHLLELALAGATLYIFVAYQIARAASHRALVRTLFAAVGLFTVTIFVWLVYHARHGQPRMVQDWDSYVSVTPFHEQLAVPVFAGLVGGIAVLAIGLHRAPRPTLGPLTS